MYRKDNKTEHYTVKANREGYPARSVYKLKDIDEKYRFFKKGDRVLDLGAAPGSWMQYIATKVGEKGFVQGVDIKDVEIEMKPNMRFLKKDMRELTSTHFTRGKYDAVVSDAAPFTSGVPSLDAGRSFELTSKAFEIACSILKPKGSFLTKLFDGEYTGDFHREIQKSFSSVKRYRPRAITKQSREIYIIARNFTPKT
ncbi:MAG: RlmE family RNA methyltransferase [bacterium]|nr:RlmE family RNA methyltransferase [bacterium]